MKIGLDQLNNPSPVWYRRLLNAVIIFVVPATGSAIAAIPPDVMSDKTKILLGIASSWIIGLLKGLQYFLGDNSSEK